jgi:intein-encoded DNA endonuclease-like protein
MAGKKGRSGRKSHYEEMDAVEIVNLSQKTVRDYLRDPNIPLDKKVLVAKDFAAKAMPTKIEANTPTYVYVVSDTEGCREDKSEVLTAPEPEANTQ